VNSRLHSVAELQRLPVKDYWPWTKLRTTGRWGWCGQCGVSTDLSTIVCSQTPISRLHRLTVWTVDKVAGSLVNVLWNAANFQNYTVVRLHAIRYVVNCNCCTGRLWLVSLITGYRHASVFASTFCSELHQIEVVTCSPVQFSLWSLVVYSSTFTHSWEGHFGYRPLRAYSLSINTHTHHCYQQCPHSTTHHCTLWGCTVELATDCGHKPGDAAVTPPSSKWFKMCQVGH